MVKVKSEILDQDKSDDYIYDLKSLSNFKECKIMWYVLRTCKNLDGTDFAKTRKRRGGGRSLLNLGYENRYKQWYPTILLIIRRRNGTEVQ